MMTEYEAKFLREKQIHPADWVIYPMRRGNIFTGFYKLVYIGPEPGTELRKEATLGAETKVPYLTVVK